MDKRSRGRPLVGPRVQIRLPEELYQRLEQDAVENERTMAASIRYILQRWFEMQDKQRQGGKP